MPGPLTRLVDDAAGRLDTDDVRHAAGQAAKAVALDAATEDLGADRAFSGFKRAVPLKAGYDLTGTGVDLNLYPAGLWNLADKGRRPKAFKIVPKAGRRRRGGRVAVMTPAGPRYSARITASRPLGTLTKIDDRLGDAVFDAVDRHLLDTLRSA